jgi:hypothetical protein
VKDKTYDLHFDVSESLLTVTDFHLQGCGSKLQHYLEGRFARVADAEEQPAVAPHADSE